MKTFEELFAQAQFNVTEKFDNGERVGVKNVCLDIYTSDRQQIKALIEEKRFHRMIQHDNTLPLVKKEAQEWYSKMYDGINDFATELLKELEVSG